MLLSKTKSYLLAHISFNKTTPLYIFNNFKFIFMIFVLVVDYLDTLSWTVIFLSLVLLCLRSINLAICIAFSLMHKFQSIFSFAIDRIKKDY